MMFKLLAVTALSSVSASAKVSPEMQGNLEKIQRDGVAADSSFGRHLLAKSRQLDESSNYSDMTFVSGYSIKFLGCHHVTQWDEDESAWYDNQSYEEAQEGNNNNEENNYNKPYISAANGRLTQKGLIRFRLCKSDSCFDHFNNGCSSNYGEYVVDMSTFLDAYIGFQVSRSRRSAANISRNAPRSAPMRATLPAATPSATQVTTSTLLFAAVPTTNIANTTPTTPTTVARNTASTSNRTSRALSTQSMTPAVTRSRATSVPTVQIRAVTSVWASSATSTVSTPPPTKRPTSRS